VKIQGCKKLLVIPSVDIRRGRCVQLVGGKPETERVYDDPVKQAQQWVSEGASYLHVIDLDAAMGVGDNFKGIMQRNPFYPHQNCFYPCLIFMGY